MLFQDSNIDNKDNIASLVTNVSQTKDITHLLPETLEQFYYRYVFELHYHGCGKVIPYFWMPNYIEATDSSARTLDIYNSSEETIHNECMILPLAQDEVKSDREKLVNAR